MRAAHDLSSLNGLRLHSRCEELFVLDDLAAIPRLLERMGHHKRVRLLGSGSNTVVASELAGLVVLVRLRGIRYRREADRHCFRVMAGESWHQFVRTAIAQGATGLANLALIPGTMGAAPVQNIGAYGVELAEFVNAVETINTTNGRTERLSAADCHFAYRDSRFKRQPELLITAVDLTVPDAGAPRLAYPELRASLDGVRSVSERQLFEQVCRVRRRKLPDPRRFPNLGSFFKNPVVAESEAEEVRRQLPNIPLFKTDAGLKLPAAALIEACGWKGRERSGVEIWRRQPLVLVNHSARTSTPLLKVADDVAASVADRFAIALEREPVVFVDS